MAFPSPKQSHLALSADIIEGADNDEKLLADSNKILYRFADFPSTLGVKLFSRLENI